MYKKRLSLYPFRRTASVSFKCYHGQYISVKLYVKLLAVIFSLAILAGCTANKSTEVTETSGTSSSETSAAKSETSVSEITAVTTEAETEAAAEAIDTSGVEYIKEALQAEWNDDVTAVNLYAEDLNGDGVKELFVNYSFQALQNGITYIYDVPDGVNKLYEIPVRMWEEKSELYEDENGAVHLIRKESYAGGTGECDLAFFDITYDNIKMPIYFKEYDWYDGGAHLLAYDLYKNCEVTPLDFLNSFSGWRCFDPEKAEYVGRFDYEEVNDAWYSGEKCEAVNTAEKEVFEDLTYISDVKEIYSFSYKEPKSFDEFWKEAAPKLAEVYPSDKAAEKAEATIVTAKTTAEAIGTSGIDYINGFAFIGQKNEMAVYHIKGDGFFRDENGEVTPLNNEIPYEAIYKLLDDIIVCQPAGNTQPCDVYIMVDGKPVLDEKISGQEHAMMLNRSSLYDDGFEITESVYDASSGGSHTFKKYQLYRDKDGFHEYGSIEVPFEEFNSLYGEAAQKCIGSVEKETECELEIFGVMYRGDGCFILNCNSPIFCEEGDEEPCGYLFYNLTLKPTDEGFSIIYVDRGVYKTALIPEIAVYPEEMYVPEENQ